MSCKYCIQAGELAYCDICEPVKSILSYLLFQIDEGVKLKDLRELISQKLSEEDIKNLKLLATERNHLNRKISTLKKSTLKA